MPGQLIAAWPLTVAIFTNASNNRTPPSLRRTKLPYSRSGQMKPRPHWCQAYLPSGVFSLVLQRNSPILPLGKNGDPMLTPADIGTIVRTTRKAQGLRQDVLAGTAGVGLRFIVDLEIGKPTVQMGKALQVLQALGCTLDVRPPASAAPRKGRP